MDFFIINDAIVQKICILGEDTEPCFEGASVTAPEVSTQFTLDNTFKNTLYSMMQDLKNVLNEGGQQMENLENTVVVENEIIEPETEFVQNEEVISEAASEIETNNEIEDISAPAEYEKKDDEDSEEEETTEETDTKDEEDKDKKYAAMEKDFNELKESYSLLQNQYQELVNFKNEIDNQRKDALIAEFYMLSDEDKADVISNKEKYTLDEIKAKLSVICFDKKINFTLNEEEKKEEEVLVYTLTEENDNLPEWVKAVKEQEKLG